MAELKAGGLALIVRNKIQENIGKTVRLKFTVAPGMYYNNPVSGGLSKNSSSSLIWVVTGDVVTIGFRGVIEVPKHGFCQCAPRNLMPIDDADPDAVITHNKELEKQQ